MSRIIFLFTIAIIFFAAGSEAQKAAINRSIDRQLAQYSPNGQSIVDLVAQLPTDYNIGGVRISLNKNQDPSVWVDGGSDQDVRDALGTVVHESVHGLTNRLAYNLLSQQEAPDYAFADDFSAFFLNEDEVYLVKHTEVYSSHELKDLIPKSLRTFRYSPYITPKANLGSQVEGFYGLMDEWNAYCQGTRTSLDVLHYYVDRANEHAPAIYLDLISNAASSRLAYYEFKYFLLSYLDHAKKDYPEVYRGLMDNGELRAAYAAVDSRFKQLLQDFDTTLQEITDRFEDDGDHRVWQKGGYFYVDGSGVGLFAEERELLVEALAASKFVKLHESVLPR